MSTEIEINSHIMSTTGNVWWFPANKKGEPICSSDIHPRPEEAYKHPCYVDTIYKNFTMPAGNWGSEWYACFCYRDGGPRSWLGVEQYGPIKAIICFYNTGYINNDFAKDNITYAMDNKTPPKEDPNNGRFIYAIHNQRDMRHISRVDKS